MEELGVWVIGAQGFRSLGVDGFGSGFKEEEFRSSGF